MKIEINKSFIRTLTFISMLIGIIAGIIYIVDYNKHTEEENTARIEYNPDKSRVMISGNENVNNSFNNSTINSNNTVNSNNNTFIKETYPYKDNSNGPLKTKEVSSKIKVESIPQGKTKIEPQLKSEVQIKSKHLTPFKIRVLKKGEPLRIAEYYVSVINISHSRILNKPIKELNLEVTDADVNILVNVRLEGHREWLLNEIGVIQNEYELEINDKIVPKTNLDKESSNYSFKLRDLD